MEICKPEIVFENIKKERIFAIDLETSDIDIRKGNIQLVSLATKNTQTAFEPWEYLPQLREILNQENYISIFHNAKFDLNFLRQAGINVKCRIFDTMVADWLLDENKKKYGLKKLVREYLPDHEVIEFDEVDGLFSKGLRYYAALDARNTYDLYEYLYPKLESEDLTNEYWTIESPIVRIIADIEYTGIRLDEPYLKSLLDKASVEIDEITNDLKRNYGDINYESPQQLAELLFKKMKFKPIKENQTGYSVDKETLETLGRQTGHEIFKKLLRLRAIQKLKNTFLEPLAGFGEFVYPSYSQTGTVTGRFSSSNPNFQNMPRGDELPEYKVRRAFIPREGNVFICIDFSQIELRMTAHYSHDTEMMRAYINDEDIHQKTADACGCSRQDAKSLNFGLIYNMQAGTLAKRLGVSFEQASEFRKRFFETYRGVRHLYKKMEEVLQHRKWIRLLSGRKRRFNFDKKITSHDIGKAVNSLIQGSSADLMKIAMVKLVEKYPDIQIIGQVHDELLIECPKDEAQERAEAYKEIMETAVKLRVPVKANYVICSHSWQEAKS